MSAARYVKLISGQQTFFSKRKLRRRSCLRRGKIWQIKCVKRYVARRGNKQTGFAVRRSE